MHLSLQKHCLAFTKLQKKTNHELVEGEKWMEIGASFALLTQNCFIDIKSTRSARGLLEQRKRFSTNLFALLEC